MTINIMAANRSDRSTWQVWYLDFGYMKSHLARKTLKIQHPDFFKQKQILRKKTNKQ